MRNVLVIFLLLFAVNSFSAPVVHVDKYTNFTAKEIDRAKVVWSKIVEVETSKCFSDFMLNRPLIQTGGDTNQQVIDSILNSNVNISLELYWPGLFQSKNVVGYRNSGDSTIHFNRRFHNGASVCDQGSNAAHEISHIIKYGHDFKPNKMRPYSVPYSINAAFKACCK